MKEAIAQVLQDAKLGIPGTTLFVYHVPDSVRNCILVIDSHDGIELDDNLPGYRKGNFKVIIRQTNYKSAMTIAKQVVSALDLHRLTVNGIYVIRMRSTHDPIAYPIPDSDVIEVAVNLWVAYVEP